VAEQSTEDHDKQPDKTGELFVDILFALVVGLMLEPLRNPKEVTLEGGFHIAVAFVMTMLSWLGYHASTSRLDPAIRIPQIHRFNKWREYIDPPPGIENKGRNLPFLHFVLDVSMVVVYWLTAVSFDRAFPRDGEAARFWRYRDDPSAFHEALFVLAAFGLYVLWDGISLMAAKNEIARLARVKVADLSQEDADKHAKLKEEADNTLVRRQRRKHPTRRCTAAVGGLFVLACFASDRWWVIGIDVSLIGVLITYRYWKELVGPGRLAQSVAKV
jgi:hypothetical protein